MRYFKKDLIKILVAIIILFLSASAIDTLSDIIVFKRNQDMLVNYQKINSSIINYDTSKVSFQLYSRTRVKKTLEDYEKSTKETAGILAELAPAFAQSERSQMNYRIVTQMLEHRNELIESYNGYIVSRGTLSTDYEYILKLSERISTQLNSLMSSYLKQMNEINSENMSWYIRTQVLSNGLTLFILSAIVLTTVFMSRKIRTKFIEATYITGEIAKRNFSVKNMERTQYIDINNYIDTANIMKEDIKTLIVQTQDYAESKIQYEKQKRLLAESKMKELQLQINPHFLFNTLSIVIRHIQTGEYQTSIKLIKETSKILRNSLGENKPTIDLDDEIELLKSYMYIQQMHLKDRVELNLDIRKAYGNEVIQVPPLIIQPLVENAVMHGMSETTRDGKINITITEKKDYIEIVVNDNGAGIKPEIIDYIQTENYGKHIGLSNVIKRLEILYERKDVFIIESQVGLGTSVTLYLYKK